MNQAMIDGMALELLDKFRALTVAGEKATIAMGAMLQSLRDLRAARLRRVRVYLRQRRDRKATA